MCGGYSFSEVFLHFLEFWTRHARPSSMKYAAPTMHEYGEYVDNECVEDHAVEVESADNCWTFYFVTVGNLSKQTGRGG